MVPCDNEGCTTEEERPGSKSLFRSASTEETTTWILLTGCLHVTRLQVARVQPECAPVCCLTFLCALLEAVVDLLEHGLAATLKDGQHDALEGVLVGGLDGPLHGFSRRPADGVCCVLGTESWWSEELKQGSRVQSQGEPLTLDLTTLVTLSFRVASTLVSLAVTVLLRRPMTGSRLFVIAGEAEGKEEEIL